MKTLFLRQHKIRMRSARSGWVAAGLLPFLIISAQAGELAPGRAVAPTPVANTANPAISAAQIQRKQEAAQAMARTTQALQTMQAAQASARALAASGANNLGVNPNQPSQQLPDVPNGLQPGGLVPYAGGIWTGANTPVQSVNGGKTLVNIQQNAAQALLTWQKFNIGKETTLNFDQSAGGANASQWVAFNKVNDPSGVPSQILGSIKAQGQVYVINQNGIIFGGTSQVNSHALVASSLPINDNLIQRGLLNNPDQQFLFSQLTIPKLTQGTMEAFVPPATPAALNGKNGDIIVQAGAQLKSPTTADHVGGRIALVGPNVKNEGTISTPDGQTILAAGNQVGFVAHDSNDPSLRGLDVYVGAVDATSGTATNRGLIDAPRAATTITGKSVNQLGVIDSSTSVSLNGRIDLLANYGAQRFTVQSGATTATTLFPTLSGTVTLGEGSVSRILPELSSTEKVVGTKLALPSQFNLQGLVIHQDSNSFVLGAGAQTTLNAGKWIAKGSQGYTFANTDGQVYLESGAVIDVGGSTDIVAPVSENIVSIELRGSELADSPLLRNGILRGQTLLIDIRQAGIYNGSAWAGTPLADANGYIGLIERNVGELTTGGGTVKINAGSSVVMQQGSKIDVSGGWINYQSGTVKTSKVIYQGHLLDISQATPDRIYDGIDNGSSTFHSKWGVRDEWGSSLASRGTYQKGYVYGASGGSITITAPSVALDGTLLGRTVQGPRQNVVLPQAASLSLSFQGQSVVAGQPVPVSPTPPSIVFKTDSTLAAADPFAVALSGAPIALREDRRNTVELSPELINENGFGSLTLINPDGNILVPANISLLASPGGTIAFTGANIDIEGKIASPGGTFTFSAPGYTPYDTSILAEPPPYNPARGNFILGRNAVLSAAGWIVDERAEPSRALATTGGSIAISGNQVSLNEGSVVDVSGGVVLSNAGKFSHGNAGAIAVKGGLDLQRNLIGGRLNLKGSLLGYSGGKGGSLTLQAPSVQIGGSTSDARTLLLDPQFFTRGGFSEYNILGLGQKTAQVGRYIPGVLVAPNVVLAPIAESWLAIDGRGSLPILLHPILKAEGLRSPISLTLGGVGVFDNGALIARGDVLVAQGAVIRTDAQGAVTLKGQTVDILGSIFAPAGSITVTGASDSSALFPDKPAEEIEHALATVHLGSRAVLSTAGVTVLTPDPRGYRSGAVLGGGKIQVTGNIVAETGSLFDVSGGSGVIDYLPAYSLFSGRAESPLSEAGISRKSTAIVTDGGSVILKGGQELFADATFVGKAGGANAAGGSITVSSGYFIPPNTGTAVPSDTTLTVTQAGSTIPSATNSAGPGRIGTAILDANGVAFNGQGYIAVNSFQNGGFDYVTLGGNGGMVEFAGPVNLVAGRSLKVGDGGFISADAAVNLKASYVALGTAFLGPLSLAQEAGGAFTVAGVPFYQPPTFGTGSLTVTADLIDVGNLSLQNIGVARLNALNGDIRGDGTLNIAGDLILKAGQIYPTTAVTFSIEAYNHGGTEGSVTIEASGIRSLPLSGGGTLNVYAAVINQRGVLRAPIGTINLGWNGDGTAPLGKITNAAAPVTRELTLAAGSTTSVSAVDPITGQGVLIPYGTNLNGTSWIDPSGIDITAGGLPVKVVNLSAVTIDSQSGSTIDVRGGGDLYAYQWVKGLGGTKDILASTTSFAIVPNYGSDFAPFDPGYANANLKVGDKIYLKGGSGLAAGSYTLLPARYALLPGAFLVTPKTTPPNISPVQPDGSFLTSGYRFNGQTDPAAGGALLSSFEIASSNVVRTRAEYTDYSANTYLREAAIARNISIPRLPMDSGNLTLAATQSLNLQGRVISKSLDGGLGSQVDISSASAIRIAGAGATAGVGELLLDSSNLSAFGADSLLIGGFRTSGTGGVTVTTTTGSLTVDNAGAALIGPDVILVSKGNLTLRTGSEIRSSGTQAGTAETLHLGSTAVAGSGDGALVRVSSDPSAGIVRQGVSTSTVPNLVVQADAKLQGASLILDSSARSSLSSSAVLSGQSVALGSDRISIQFADGGSLQPNPGLVLSSSNLVSLQATAKNLSLLSYSSIDLYGTGSIGSVLGSGSYSLSNLGLSAAEIRSFNNGGGTVELNASNIALNNNPGRTGPGSAAPLSGTLALNGNTVVFGKNALRVDQLATVNVNASGGILLEGTGDLTTAGTLNLNAPVIVGATGSNHSLVAAGGALTVSAPASGAATVTAGLGASLLLQGVGVTVDGNILLPSGTIKILANTGDILVNGRLDVGGTEKSFFDVTRYTSGGNIALTSKNGSVTVGSDATLSVAARPGAGDAGNLSIATPNGVATLQGALLGQGGNGGKNGSFALDTQSLASLGALNSVLNNSGFTEARSFRIRTGNVLVDGLATSHAFGLSVDQGSLTVTGTIDARGTTGGSVQLVSGGSVVLASGSLVTVAAIDFNAAGKGGSVSLEAGSEINGSHSTSAVVDVQTGSVIDLSVASNTLASPGLGRFTGTLHIRAPQNAAQTDLQINPINGVVAGASSILVEGYQTYNPSGGLIDNVIGDVFDNGTTFAGNTAGITSRILANNAALAPVTVIAPGAEIINPTGDLTLADDWDLSAFRFGPKNTAGVVTLRAKGNLIFSGSLSDGFVSSFNDALLMDQNQDLPTNTQSWSYRLIAGADFSAADFHRVGANTATYDAVTGLATLGTATGSVLLGNLITNNNGIPVASGGLGAQTADALVGRYQVIRTGTGDIDIVAAGDVLLRNQFASIYTAGTAVTDPTMGGRFDLPILQIQTDTFYPAQYSVAGGNVNIAAQGNIAHVTRNIAGQIVQDSQKELPNNWLYRRGYFATSGAQAGQFGTANIEGDTAVASTTWWVDFSNFFEGVGALGGGNVTLTAGHDVSNVDAVIPTNSRTTKQTTTGDKIAANQSTIELGGGDLIVSAGNDINGGVYYVERGNGELQAGRDITTNSTRSTSLGALRTPAQINDSRTWLPTTLFLGKGNFDVQAQRDLLLGPVANPFLLPQGINNTYWNKTYFSTYAPTSSVTVTSLTGDVTLREAATLTASTTATPLLQNWLQSIDLFLSNATTVSYYQPWLRLTETKVDIFSSLVALQPASLKTTAFAGDINLAGNLTLSPSPTGTVEFLAAGSVNALQPTGISNRLVLNSSKVAWTAATINLSDANPGAIPGVLTPFAYQSIVGSSAGLASSSDRLDLSFINKLFAESGSTQGSYGVLQTKQQLHANLDGKALHEGDSEPLRIYAEDGDISGLKLFSGKSVQVVAGEDITDVAFYIQNVGGNDVSLVSAGRNLTIYNPNSVLRSSAQAAGNAVSPGSETLAGDIQINGPGSLEVLAGGNLDLGVGPNNSDGTGLGITSVGNKRNPLLPSAGADIVAGAGLGNAPDYASFIAQFINTSEGTGYLQGLGYTQQTFNLLSGKQKELVALDVFYLILRDAGRDHNDPSGAGGYGKGFAAIQALFPVPGDGDISLTSREFKTQSGGNISLFNPGGGLTIGFDAGGNQPLDQGILTEAGGNISIFTRDDVVVGTSRIFTLRGGDIVIWSSDGDIAAGASSKTVQSAPPTRVLIDPQSGDVFTDLAGLATGGGIGVLDTVEGVPPGDVDLIAPNGTVDAGDAGIRVSGNLNIAAVQVLNASNIQAGGTNTGGTVAAVASPSVSGLTAGASATAANSNTANEMGKKAQEQNSPTTDLPSIITVEVLGYGGDSDEEIEKTSQSETIDSQTIKETSYQAYRNNEKKL